MLICITGGSGCGKSTVTDLLEGKLINSKIIRVDDIMKKNIKEIYKSEIVKSFNLDQLNPNPLFESFDSIKKWMAICGDNMNLEVEKIANEYNKVYDYVLIDYSLLPIMDVFNKCDMSIDVVADTDIKLHRLKNRLQQCNSLQKWKDDESIIKRINSTSLDLYGFKSEYTIMNNSNLEDLELQINSIAEIIKSKHDVNGDGRLS